MKRFKAYQGGDDSAIPPNIRQAVFSTAVRCGGSEQYEYLKTVVATGGASDRRDAALLAMGKVRNRELARNFLDFNISDAVANQDRNSGIMSLAGNSTVRDEVWAWFKSDWATIEKRVGGNSTVLARFVKRALENFADHKIERDIAHFFADKDTGAFDMMLKQIADSIKRNANYRERETQLILEWLKAKGYV